MFLPKAFHAGKTRETAIHQVPRSFPCSVALKIPVVSLAQVSLAHVAPNFGGIVQQTLVLLVRGHAGEQILIPATVRLNNIVFWVVRVVFALGTLEPKLLFHSTQSPFCKARV